MGLQPLEIFLLYSAWIDFPSDSDDKVDPCAVRVKIKVGPKA